MKKEISCGCIIFDKESHNKVLIIHQINGDFWGFPKGHVEENETEVETALREVKEEVGIDVEVIDERLRYEFSYIIEDEQIDKTNVYYVAEPIGNGAKLKNQEIEIKNVKWVTIEEALKKLTYDASKDVLKKAYKDLQKMLRNK